MLGVAAERLDDGDALLPAVDGGPPALWVNRVPEPKAVKNRVHLDVWVPDEDALLARGVTRLADHGAFRLLADPEGNEFCAFPPPAPGRSGMFALCTDSPRPREIAGWWAGIVGGEVGPGPDGVPRYLHGVRGLGDLIWKFVPTDDPRVVKNRWHWDVTGDVGALVAAGATLLRARDGEIAWSVLADPDGNEFCAFDDREDLDAT